MSDLLAGTIGALREIVKTKIHFEVGTAIRFNSISRKNGQEQKFNYIALLADDNRWYLTGVTRHYGDRLTTAEFLNVLKNEDVVDVSVAAEWDAV